MEIDNLTYYKKRALFILDLFEHYNEKAFVLNIPFESTDLEKQDYKDFIESATKSDPNSLAKWYYEVLLSQKSIFRKYQMTLHIR